MPSARPADLRPDALMTEDGQNYMQNADTFVMAQKASTLVKVKKPSNKYFVWSKDDMFRDEIKLRGRGDTASIVGQGVSFVNYSCDDYDARTPLTDRDRSEGEEIDLEAQKIALVAEKIRLKRDKLYASKCFAASNWTANTAQSGVTGTPGANQFKRFDESSSDPLTVIRDNCTTVRVGCGRRANTLVMDRLVYDVLEIHPDVLDLFKHTNAGPPSKQQVAQALGVQNIVVSESVENTAKGGATASVSAILGKHILCAYIAPEPNRSVPTAVSTFSWDEFDGGNDINVYQYRWDEIRGVYIEASSSFDIKVTAEDAGVFLSDVIS